MTSPEPDPDPDPGSGVGPWAAVDPFDLPEWLGTGDVTWVSDMGLCSGLVRGRLVGGDAGEELDCDLLAADVAYPQPVVDEATRAQVHQVWQHGEVHLVARDGRLTLAAPGTRHGADDVLELLSRLARAVGAPGDRFAARLRVARRS